MMVQPILEHRLRTVADMLEEAAAELKSSIVELEKGASDDRRPEPEAGRRPG